MKVDYKRIYKRIKMYAQRGTRTHDPQISEVQQP